MKGIELPINILVIVAVAIIVLLGVIALFYSSWFSSTQPVTSEAVKSQMCNIVNRQTNPCTDVAPAIIKLQTTYKGYADLGAFCWGEYSNKAVGVFSADPGAAGWAANSADAKKCLNIACGLQC